jgi:hypothetical protein
VVLSSRVTTRSIRPSSSSIAAQNRYRLCSCGSVLRGCSTTRIHHSYLMYGRLRKTSFSKYSVNLYPVMRQTVFLGACSSFSGSRQISAAAGSGSDEGAYAGDSRLKPVLASLLLNRHHFIICNGCRKLGGCLFSYHHDRFLQSIGHADFILHPI